MRHAALCLLVVLALLVGAVAPPRAARADEATIPELVEQLSSDDYTARSRALNALRNRKDPDAISLLVDRIEGMDSSAQYYAIMILEAFDARTVRRPLRELLHSEAPYVRVCAAQLLHKNGAKGMASVIAKELTDPALPRAEWQRAMVRMRYGRLPVDERLVLALTEPVVPAADAQVIRETAYVLEDVPLDVPVPAFESLLEDERAGVRAVAAAYLRSRGQDRDGVLADALRTGAVPSADMYFIQNVLTDSQARSPGPVLVDALIEGTESCEDTNDLRAVAQLLGRLGDKRALPRLRELVRHETEFVAKAAADAVAALSGTKATAGSAPTSTDAEDTVALTSMLKKRDVDALAAWLEDPEKPERRLSAADALRRMDDPRGLPQVLAEVTSENAVLRRSAVKILGNFRVADGVEPLIGALLDDDTTVRSYARSALQTTLTTLFPMRRFQIVAAGRGGETADDREWEVDRLRAWWESARDADW